MFEKTTKKTRILYLIDTLIGKGGSENNLLQVIRGLDKNLYEPYVFCLQGGPLSNEILKEGFSVTDLKLKRVYGWKGLKAARRLFVCLKKRKIDILVTYHEGSDFLGAVMGRAAGVPVIVSTRRDMGYKLKLHHLLIYRLINNLFDAIITVSDAVGYYVSKRQGVMWHKILTIYNGVKLEHFNVKTEPGAKRAIGIVDEEAPVIGMIAAFRPVKGFEYIIEAHALLAKEFPRAYLLLVGLYNPTDPYYLRIRQLIGEKNLGQRVIVPGASANVAQVISMMDICVSPSLSEGFSNAVLEYMASGKPVVATNSGGNPEAITDGINGVLVPPGDSAALAEALADLLRYPHKGASLGARALKTVQNRFSFSVMMDRLDAVYSYLLQKQERHPFSLPSARTIFRSLTCKTAKFLISQGLYYSGASFFIRQCGHKKTRGIRILAYHRVADLDFDPLGMAIPVALFEMNVRHLAKEYNVMSLEEAKKILESGTPAPERAIVLTFDDGYKDNYIYGFPIMKRYGVTATIFVAIRAVEGETLWFDRIVDKIARHHSDFIDLSAFKFKKFSLRSRAERAMACRQLVTGCKYLERSRRDELISYLDEALGADDRRRGSLMLDWGEIRHMQERGISFGSHGLSHSLLTTIPLDEVYAEALESRNVIARETGVVPEFFSNPNGGMNDSNEGVNSALREAGYRATCTLVKGINMPGRSFSLKRYCISQGMLSHVPGIYSHKLFDMQMSRVYPEPSRAGEAKQVNFT